LLTNYNYHQSNLNCAGGRSQCWQTSGWPPHFRLKNVPLNMGSCLS